MRLILVPALVLALAPALPAAAAPAKPRLADRRDYAIASCLIHQKVSPSLQAEGYKLADIVIRRAGIDPFAWAALDRAVAAKIAQRRMMMVHVDAPVAEATQPAVLATCLEVVG